MFWVFMAFWMVWTSYSMQRKRRRSVFVGVDNLDVVLVEKVLVVGTVVVAHLEAHRQAAATPSELLVANP